MKILTESCTFFACVKCNGLASKFLQGLQFLSKTSKIERYLLALIVLGLGGRSHHVTKNLEKCSCLQINNSALIKQMSLFDNALSHYRALKVFIQNEKKNNFWPTRRSKGDRL